MSLDCSAQTGEDDAVWGIREPPQAVSIPLGPRGNCSVPGKTERSLSQTRHLSTVKVELNFPGTKHPATSLDVRLLSCFLLWSQTFKLQQTMVCFFLSSFLSVTQPMDWLRAAHDAKAGCRIWVCFSED